MRLEPDLFQRKLLSIVLNSEKITIYSQKELFHVRVVYDTDQIEFSNSFASSSMVKFPMMDFDFQDPMKSITKLQRLMVFL